MKLEGQKLSDTYKNLLSVGPGSVQTITLGDGGVVPWKENGVVVTSNDAQTVDGLKTFAKNLTIQPTLNFTSQGSFVKAGNHTVTLTTTSNSNITFSAVTARTYTVPNVTVDASFVMTEGAQIINGNKTLNGEIKIYGDTEIGLTGTATNLFGTGASSNKFGDSVSSSNTFGNNVSGSSATNSFGSESRYNSFGEKSNINRFGALVTGNNHFGIEVSGSNAYNNFGTDLKSGARNNFGKNSKNFFGENGENYFYSGLFAGPVTMPSSGINFTNAGRIVKAGTHSLGLTTTAETTGTFPAGNINIAALEGQQTFAGEKTFSSGINILKISDQLVLGSTQKTTITAPTPASARTYTIPDVSGNASFVMTTGNQTIGGLKTFTTGQVIQVSGGNQLTFRTGSAGNKIDITAPTITGDRTYTLPDVGGNASFVMSTGNQNIGGLKTFTERPYVNGNAILMSGDSLLGTTTQYSIKFGYGISGHDFSWNGNGDKTVNINTSEVVVTAGNQIVGGQKTFSTGQIIQSTGGNQLTFRTGEAGNKINITATTITGDRVYTLPDIGSNASFVMASGTQNIGGLKTFTDPISFTKPVSFKNNGNQLAFQTGDGGNSITVNAPTISGNRTYILPDVSGDASFIMSTGNQTIGGVKNFTTRPTLNGVNLLVQGDTSIFSKVEATNLVYNTGDQPVSGHKTFENLAIRGPFINDTDAEFNGSFYSREVYCTDDGSVKAAVEIPSLDIVYETGATRLTSRKGPTPTLTRIQTNTSGSYLGSNGYIKYATGDEPRFDYAVSKNLFRGSNSFLNFERYPFTNGAPNYVEDLIAPRSEINPFKSEKDADKIIDVTGSGAATTYQIRRDAILRSGLNYTMSVFAKPINNNFISLQLGPVRALYNLSNNSISGINGTATSSGIDSSYGNGWSRLWISTAYNQATSSQVNAIYPSNISGNTQRIITIASDSFYLWGPQLEENSTPSQYEISIGASSDPYKSFRTPKGLLIENNSSNLVLNSNRFTGPDAGGAITGSISLTGGAWPDGSGTSYSGAVYVENNVNGLYGVYRDPVNIATGINYVSSIFLKQPASGSILGRRYVLGRLFTNNLIPDTRVVIDLDSGISGGMTTLVPGYTTPTFYTGIRYPNNWYRLIIGQRALHTTAGSGGHFYLYSTTGSGIDTGSYAGLNGPSFQMFGHQIEALPTGDSATSYKLTTGTSGLLGRDVVRIAGNDFQSFYNQSQGTFFIEAELLNNNAATMLGMFGIEGINRPSGNYSLTRAGNAFRTTFSSAPPNYLTQAQFSKTTGLNNISVIASYKENGFKNSFYNEAIITDANGKLGMQPMSKMIFGANGEDSGPSYCSMYLQRFSYWPLQLQNNRLTGIYRY